MSTQTCGCDPEAGWKCADPNCATRRTAVSKYAPIPGTIVIGLGHKARHGKDSAAQIMIESYPQVVKRFALADALRCYCRVEHGMTVKDAPLLQKIGVEMRRRNPNTWIDALYWQLVESAPRIAVITDVRFENEAAFVKQLGGTLVRITRIINDEGDPYQATDRDPNHVSETELNGYPWDESITARDVTELRGKVLNFFVKLASAVVLTSVGDPTNG